jgi:hypothetical protein
MPLALARALCALPRAALAGAQAEEQLSPVGRHAAVSGRSPTAGAFELRRAAGVRTWLDQMSPRLTPRIPEVRAREDFLATVITKRRVPGSTRNSCSA